MLTLGINAVYHDSSACIVRDGRVLAAAEDERFTAIKHGKRPIPFSTYELPFHAIHFCLKAAGATLADVDHVAYSYNPHVLLGPEGVRERVEIPLVPPSGHANGHSPWDPLFLSHILNAPAQLVDGAPHHLSERFAPAKRAARYKWHFVDHHVAHAASAYLPSPFEEAAVLTLDGRGEEATTSYYVGRAGGLEPIGEVRMPHSLGLLYEEVTDYLGFLRSSDEYKVMALASYGRPKYADAFRKVIRREAGGDYRIERADFVELFGPARLRGGDYEDRHFDVARSLQAALEETALDLARWLREKTGCEDLCMAGGVALNCVMNARIRDEAGFRRVWVQPAAGDAGTSLGAALFVDSEVRGRGKKSYVMDHAFLGPEYPDEEIEAFLRWSKAPFRRLENVAEEAADLLAEDKVIGWFQGRMEFGPRALGGRSILASPLHASMQAKLNEIKDREDFRPVAPVVLAEEAGEWFEGACESPFMLFVYPVRADKADRIPAVRHVDGTARIQTVRREQNPRYHDLLKAFRARTGVPVLVNTSFNTRGKPIVCTPRDAVECFWTSPFDALVIGSYLLEKP